jgi:hypothetical protein
MKKSMKRLRTIVKWGLLLVILYFVLTTLYFGYDDIDSNKGIYKFYWSGLRGVWEKDREFGFKRNEIVQTRLDGVDGPYVFQDSLFYVTGNNAFVSEKLDSGRIINVETNCQQLPVFSVLLKDRISIENDQYDAPDKLIAISDIEGNFTGLYSFLLVNKVIDKNAKWIFGSGHLVLNGDLFDRGKEVSQVLWLIYSLEKQAEMQGGKVHYILGNHEIMNMYGDVSYNDFKYMEVAKRISKQNDWDKGLKHLYSADAELGKWLRSKNIIEKIGDNIFVHGGVNIAHVRGKYSIRELNDISRKYNGIVPSEENVKNERDRQVLSSINSPYWDRRLNLELQYKVVYMLNGIDAKETSESELDTILNFYTAKRLVIGHCVVNDITTGYNNKVIKIDVKHGAKMNSGKTKGLFIDHGFFYKIDDQALKEKLFTE